MSLADELAKKYPKVKEPRREDLFKRETTGTGQPRGFGAGRFALETGGILAGARAGAPFGLPGMALGGGLGFALAKRAGKTGAQFVGAEPASELPLGQQILESIKTLPQDVAVGAASEAAGPFIGKAVGGIRKAAAFPFIKVGRGIKNLLARSGVPQELTQEIFEHPSTFFRKGSPEKVAQTIEKISGAIEAAKTKVSKLYDRAKSRAGIKEKIGTLIEKMASGEIRPLPPTELAGKYLALKQGISVAATDVQKKAALRKLMDFRRQLDQTIKWSKTPSGPISAEEGVILKQIRADVNAIIPRFPGGKLIRQADRRYGETIEKLDDLQTQFSDITKGGGTLEGVTKTGGSLRSVLKGQEALKGIRGFEEATGQELFQPFVRESAALASEPLIPMSGIMSPFLGEAGVAGAGMLSKAKPAFSLAARAASSQFATRGLALRIVRDIMERTPTRPPVRDLREMTTLQP